VVIGAVDAYGSAAGAGCAATVTVESLVAGIAGSGVAAPAHARPTITISADSTTHRDFIALLL